MRLLFNATSTIKGGGAQRAASFIRELRWDMRAHEWCIAYSPSQDEVLQGCLQGIRTQRFEHRPSQNTQSRRDLLRLEQEFQPHCVYTLGGPAYVRFRSPHLMGVADGWVTHSTLEAYRTLPFPTQWLRMFAASLYKVPWLWRANAWVIQTESARQSLHRRLRIPLRRIAVVPNTCASIYLDASRSTAEVHSLGPVRILCFAAPYYHKRLDLLAPVAAEMVRRAPHLNFRFVVTLPRDCSIWIELERSAQQLGVASFIENRGPVSLQDGPQLYQECQVCFMPTVLETFSASYPEAMAMERPMVTSDLSFARDVCREAAIYFQPNHVQDAAEKLLRVLGDASLRAELIRMGRDSLSRLPTAQQQYHLQVDLMEALAENRFGNTS